MTGRFLARDESRFPRKPVPNSSRTTSSSASYHESPIGMKPHRSTGTPRTDRIKMIYILSLPRSGSSVLSALLDRQKGLVAVPESAFPQILGTLSPAERKDRRWLAALYLGAAMSPTPLNLDEAEECMIGDDQEMLARIGLAVARKMGRDPSEIQGVVWKTPKVTAALDGPLATNGVFVVLRRNPHNVFESQFRFHFGANNRRPLRFAIFRESYESGFDRIPGSLKIDVEYDALPGAIDSILEFAGLENAGTWENHVSTLARASEQCYWLKGIDSQFVNRDAEKRGNLEPAQVRNLDRALKLARALRGLLLPIRHHFDRVSVGHIRTRAVGHLEARESTSPEP